MNSYSLGYLWEKRCVCGSGFRSVYIYAFYNSVKYKVLDDDVTKWQLIISTHYVPNDAFCGGLSLQKITNYFICKNIVQLQISGGIDKLVDLSIHLTVRDGWTRL